MPPVSDCIAAELESPALACVPQAPATATGLLYYGLALAAGTVADNFKGNVARNHIDDRLPSLTAEKFRRAVALDKQLYLAVANSLGWFCSYPTASVRQPEDISQDSRVRKAAEALHVAVQQASKVQADTLNTAEDAAAATALAASAVALLSFAESDCRRDGRAAYVGALLPGGMQTAATAAGFLRSLAQLLQAGGDTAARSWSALASKGAAAALRRLLSWLAEPITAVATSSGVLAEALPALAALAEGDGDACRQLAAEGGPHEWAPVAAALRRRLPRRMAARFLPEVDHVTAVIRTGRLGFCMGSLHVW